MYYYIGGAMATLSKEGPPWLHHGWADGTRKFLDF